MMDGAMDDGYNQASLAGIPAREASESFTTNQWDVSHGNMNDYWNSEKMKSNQGDADLTKGQGRAKPTEGLGWGNMHTDTDTNIDWKAPQPSSKSKRVLSAEWMWLTGTLRRWRTGSGVKLTVQRQAGVEPTSSRAGATDLPMQTLIGRHPNPQARTNRAFGTTT